MLAVDNLNVTIANQQLLTNIGFHLEENDYLCILGANGAGKSTLLKTLIGIITPTSGKIMLGQQNIDQLSQKQRACQLAYVAQNHSPYTDFQVDDFIRLARYPYHRGLSDWSQQDQHAYERAVTITDTDSFLSRQLDSLSGGERQRVMIAAAVCQQTPILLLDEPTSFLDPHHQAAVHRLTQQLNQQHGITIIEVTHDFNHAVQHSKHILALKNGHAHWHGQACDVFNDGLLTDIYQQNFTLVTHPDTGIRFALPANSLVEQ